MKDYDKGRNAEALIWRFLLGIALKTIGYSLVKNNPVTWGSGRDWDCQGKLFSGKVVLKVTQGRIRNRGLSIEDKEVFPHILESLRYSNLLPHDITSVHSFNGLIICHIRDNDLYKVDIKLND